MALSADVIDNLIAATLLQKGRVCAVDLVGVDEAERADVLAAYFDRHLGASSPLHFEGGDLVSGPDPASGGSLEADPISDVDLLLEGYEGGEAPTLPTPVASGVSAPGTGAGQAAIPASSPPAAVASSRGGRVDTAKGVPKSGDGQPRSYLWLLWWVPVLLIPLFGGIAAWSVLRHKRERIARVMLGIGIGVGMLGSIVFLRYAGDIAGFVSGASQATVITLPSGSASSQPTD